MVTPRDHRVAFVSIQLLTLICVLGCPAPRARPGWDVSSPDGRAVHRASGLSFPRELPELERGTTRVFDPSGSDASVAYAGSTFPLEITVFVYPRSMIAGGSAADHFRAALSAIHQDHPGARLESTVAMRLALAGDDVDAATAFLTFVDRGKDLGSWLIVLAADDRWIVKVRATYERGEEGTAGVRLRQSFRAVESILQSIRREGPASV